MRINKPYTNKEYADLAVYCNHNDCHIEDKGDYLESVQNEHPAPTYEEVRQIRAALYQQEVDPITAHISRLRDEAVQPEGEIAELIAERAALVEKIKQENPYPEGEEK